MTRPAFISLGSNIEPELNLLAAAEALRELGKPVSASNIYRNPAVGPTPQPDFLNAAILISTSMEALDVRQRLRLIESDLGRIRTADKYAPRTIDLDLCLLGDVILNQEQFVLPDPDLARRSHLAVPMAELDPDFVHPVLLRSLADIASDLAPHDNLEPMPEVTKHFRQAFLHYETQS